MLLKTIISEITREKIVHRRDAKGKLRMIKEEEMFSKTLAGEDIKENWKAYQRAFLEGK